MGKVDAEAKRYFSRNDRFADAFNFFVYNGEQVVDPRALAPLDSAELVIPYGNDARSPQQKVRDLVKLWQAKTDEQAVYVVLGLESQATVHYAMPVRCGLYDFINYAAQVEEAARSYRENGAKEPLTSSEFLSGFGRDDKLMPVITIVIYLGSDVWDAPLSIHDMFDTDDKRVLELIPNYHINLIAPANIQDGDFDKFETDVGEVLKFMKYQDDKNKLRQVVSTDEKYTRLEEDAVGLLQAASGITVSRRAGEERVNVANVARAIAEMCEDSRQEGREEGREEMREEMRRERVGTARRLMDKLHMSAEEALALLDVPAEQRQEVLALL